MQTSTSERAGLVWALLAVTAFSLTFPATKLALQALPVAWVGAGRGALAGLAAGLVLWGTRARLPERRYWGRLAVVALCSVIGFPWLIAQAMTTLTVGYSAIIVGAVPLMTAAIAAWRGGERLSPPFWIAAAAGSVALVAYGATHLGGTIDGSLFLLGAALCAAIGYAEGGRLAAELGGPRVMSWSVVLALPFLLPGAVSAAGEIEAPGAAWMPWLAFLYLSLVSQWLAFYPWYKGMTLAGVARAAQVQQIQVFLTLAVSSLWLDESVGWVDALVAAWVVACVVVAQRAPRVALSGPRVKAASA